MEKIIKSRVGLLKLGEELNNVSKACKLLGFSRDTFYRYKNAVENGGIEALREESRAGKPNLRNRCAPELEEKLLALAIEFPAWGQHRVSNELRKFGYTMSPAGIRGVWKRNNLETINQRLKALEEKVASEGIILTESQVVALEAAKLEKQACGEIETEHPGYLGSQDTYYVGNIKGVGRIYQQTFVDTYSKVAVCKLYTMKNAITAADALNDKVLPFFEEQGVPLLRVLTDRGTEYCGSEDSHEYKLYLALEDIEHTRTKAKHPQTNGICERFHKTIHNEFYRVTFRKHLYQSLEQLQVDLDTWLGHYNNERTHQGKHCLGRTPMQTFKDDKQKAFDKDLTLYHVALQKESDDQTVIT